MSRDEKTLFSGHGCQYDLAMRTFEWAIEDIVAAYPSLSLEHAAAMAVALMRRTGPPCRFVVQVDGLAIDEIGGDTQFVLEVTWSQETEVHAKRMERTEQRTPIVERAAIAVAALLLCHFVSGSDLEVLKQSARADYWLPEKHQAVEISGTEHWREIKSRRRQKRRQVLENIFGMDGHVLICGLKKARAPYNGLIIRKRSSHASP
jgi:hypothetical protein